MKIKQLLGGFAPFMFGILMCVTTISLVTENHLRGRMSDYHSQYIENKRKNIQQQVESYKYDVLQENSGTYVANVSGQLRTNIETNIFDNARNAQTSSDVAILGTKKVLVTNNDNWNSQNKLTASNQADALLNVESSDNAGYVDDESIRNQQEYISYKNMMKQASSIYETLIRTDSDELPDTITPEYVDVWGRNFNYVKDDGFNGKLSFDLPWDNSKNIYLSLKLPEELKEEGVFEIVLAKYFAFLITDVGDLWVVGYNGYGHLGLGHTTIQSSWTKTSLSNIKKVLFSDYTAMALSKDGTLYGAGRNEYGQLGLGHENQINSWTELATNVKDVYLVGGVAYYIDNSGDVFSTGVNTAGRLGIGVTGNKNIWQDSSIDGVDRLIIHNNGSSYAIKDNGDLWAVGGNFNGQLGIGNNVNQLLWVDTNLKNISDVKVGNYTSVAVSKIDNKIYGAGKNTYGQLGIGTASSQNSWVEPDLSNVGTIDKFYIGWLGFITYIVNSDNELWGAGLNSQGELGIVANTTNQYEFKKSNISGVKDYYVGDKNVVYAVKTDGTIFSVGKNASGQLGTGDLNSSTSIWAQIPGISNVSKVYLSKYGDVNAYIIDNSGGLYVFGDNDDGELGVGNKLDQKLPVSIGISNIDSVFIGELSVYIMDKDLNFYSTGNNLGGQLGVGDFTDRSTFTQTTLDF